MDKSFALRHSAAAVAAVLAVAASADGFAATQRTPAAPGAPPASTTAPATSTPAPGTPGGAGASATMAATDRNFVTMAASSGMLEVDASRLALERSQNGQVRTFAQRMVDDHTKANEELKAVAKKAGVADVPATMMPTHSAHLERLRALNGPAFDQEYAAQIGVAAHNEAVALFDKASRDAANPDLKAFAGKTAPKLRDHLKQSQALASAVGVSADRMKAAGAPPDPATSSTMGSTGTTGSDSTTGSAGAGSATGASGTPGGAGGTGGAAAGSGGGSTAGSTTGSSGTGTGGGTGTNPTPSTTGK